MVRILDKASDWKVIRRSDQIRSENPLRIKDHPYSLCAKAWQRLVPEYKATPKGARCSTGTRNPSETSNLKPLGQKRTDQVGYNVEGDGMFGSRINDRGRLRLRHIQRGKSSGKKWHGGVLKK